MGAATEWDTHRGETAATSSIVDELNITREGQAQKVQKASIGMTLFQFAES